MSPTGEQPGWRERAREMDDELAALAAELAQDAGVSVPSAPGSPSAGSPSAGSPSAASPGAPRSPRSRAAPPRPPGPSGPSEPAPPAPTATLEAMCARLLASMREMLAGYELALTHVSSPDAGTPSVTVAAGPFGSVSLLARFEDALRALPDVSEVAVRGYEGSDRALLEVQLRERVA